MLTKSRDTREEALGRSKGDVRYCLLSMPIGRYYIRVKNMLLKFDIIGSYDSSGEKYVLKTDKPLHIYVHRYSKIHYAVTKNSCWEQYRSGKVPHLLAFITSIIISDKILP